MVKIEWRREETRTRERRLFHKLFFCFLAPLVALSRASRARVPAETRSGVEGVSFFKGLGLLTGLLKGLLQGFTCGLFKGLLKGLFGLASTASLDGTWGLRSAWTNFSARCCDRSASSPIAARSRSKTCITSGGGTSARQSQSSSFSFESNENKRTAIGECSFLFAGDFFGDFFGVGDGIDKTFVGISSGLHSLCS